MYKLFLNIIDWFEKFFKRFKVVGYFIVIGFFIFYIVENGWERKEAIRIAERFTGLDMEREIHVKEKAGWRKERLKLQDSIYNIKEQRDSVLVLKDQEAWRSSKYRRERDEARRELKEYTPSTSYVFLDQEAYPFIGDKEYRFNGRQVTGMHETYIDNEHNKNIIGSQQAEIDHCNDALAMTEGIEGMQGEAMEMAKEEIISTEAISEIDQEKAEISMKQWKKERRKKNWGKVKTWVVGGASFIGGFILGGK